MNTEALKELEEGLDGVTPGPWSYMPREFDDWGTIRAPDDSEGIGFFVANARAGRHVTDDEFSEHRRNGTDPYEANGRHLSRCSPDNIRALISLIREERSAREKAERERDEARAERDELHRNHEAYELIIGHKTYQEVADEIGRVEELSASYAALEDRADAAESELARLRGDLAGGWRVKPLVWEDIHQQRSDEDPNTEVVGWEASTSFGWVYEIRELWHPDGRIWHVIFNLEVIAGEDDIEAAKAAALADYEARVRAAIEPAPAQETKHG